MSIRPSDTVTNGQLEVRENGGWKTLLKGITLQRDENVLTFPAATGDAVRFSFPGNEKAREFHDVELFPAL